MSQCSRGLSHGAGGVLGGGELWLHELSGEWFGFLQACVWEAAASRSIPWGGGSKCSCRQLASFTNSSWPLLSEFWNWKKIYIYWCVLVSQFVFVCCLDFFLLIYMNTETQQGFNQRKQWGIDSDNDSWHVNVHYGSWNVARECVTDVYDVFHHTCFLKWRSGCTCDVSQSLLSHCALSKHRVMRDNGVLMGFSMVLDSDSVKCAVWIVFKCECNRWQSILLEGIETPPLFNAEISYWCFITAPRLNKQSKLNPVLMSH